jgi:hypothetical protein
MAWRAEAAASSEIKAGPGLARPIGKRRIRYAARPRDIRANDFHACIPPVRNFHVEKLVIFDARST